MIEILIEICALLPLAVPSQFQRNQLLYLLPCAHVYKLKSQLVEADFDGDFSVWIEKELYVYESGMLN
jgi:hypothetical protein